MKYLKIATVLLSVVLLLTGSLQAMVPTPLPTLKLTSVSGQAVTTRDLPNKGNWLLIYINPRSYVCDDLLKLFQKDGANGPAAGAVIVVDGTVNDLQKLRTKYAGLAAAAWYVDTSHQAFNALKLHGFPVVIGVTQQNMEWMLNGIVPDRVSFMAILNNWLKQRTPQK
jgi:hypothetical protein